MFDFINVNINKILPIGLISISVMLCFSYLSIVFYRMLKARGNTNDEWRDPPPLIFKMFKPVVRLFSADVKVGINDKKYNEMQMKLSSAGMYYSILPEEFVTLRFVCLTVGVLSSIWVYWVLAPVTFTVLIVLGLVVIVSYAYPDIWLKDRIKARRTRVEREFPFLLDLLILSMKAGLNYSNALSQSISSLKTGPVKEDFGRLQRELKAGKARKDALVELAERMNSPAIRNFVSALNQAEETGGEIVNVLQGQAEQRRTERFQQAEEKAGKAPVKMLLPMMVFLFPLIFMLVGFVILVGLAESGLLSNYLMGMLGY